MSSKQPKKVLILGANGFIGRNLTRILSNHIIFRFTRELNEIQNSETFDLVLNCIGCNRSDSNLEFEQSNVFVLDEISEQLQGKRIHTLVNLSTKHAGSKTSYGVTKEAGEHKLRQFCSERSIEFHNLRLPGVFGPGMKPSYNSVIATWCFNAANRLPLRIDEPDKNLELTHILDVACVIESIIDGESYDLETYTNTLSSIAHLIERFRQYETDIVVYEPLTNFERHLFSCYMSYLEPSDTFASLIKHGDERGSFVEVFKKPGAGQISVSITPPGSAKRGMHFHTSKIERFYVAQGEALITNKCLETGKQISFTLSADDPKTFITIPNWAHWLENTSDVDLVLVIWASEHFDPERPDTVPCDYVKC